MIIENDHASTPLDGLSLAGGTPFTPIDDDASCAIYTMDSGLSVGIVYESGSFAPYLRVHPSVQLPPFARDEREWKKWSFCDEDDRTVGINMDPDDGELRYVVKEIPRDVESVEREISNALAYMKDLYPRLLGYIRDQWGGSRS